MSFTVVTCLYDIGRANADGRTIDDYVSWFNVTLTIPLPFIIFLDPDFDATRLTLKPTDRIIRLSMDELPMFRHRARVEEISAGETVNHRDLTFRLPTYSMLVMSKVELFRRAALEVESDHLVWIDAGLSRFLPDLSEHDVQRSTADLEGVSFLLNTAPFLDQYTRLGRLPKRIVGSCLALMGGGDFLVARSFASELADRLSFLAEVDWLPNGLWDNEQVGFGTLLFRGGLPGVSVLSTTMYAGNTTRWLFGLPLQNRALDFSERWTYSRREIKARLTPKRSCYLPGDFPEADFQAWAKNRHENAASPA